MSKFKTFLLKTFLNQVFLIFSLFFLISVSVFASAGIEENNLNTNNYSADYKNIYKNIYKEAGIDEIVSRYLDYETNEQIKSIFDFEKNCFEKNCFDEDENSQNFQNSKKNFVLALSPTKIFKVVFGNFKAEIKKMHRFIFEVVAVILISGLLESFKLCFSSKGLDEIFNGVSVLCVFAIVGYPIIESVKAGEKVVWDVCSLVKSFMPVYLGMMSTCGLPLTGGVYNIFMLSACQLFSQILSEKMLAIIGVYMAVCLVGTMTMNFNITKLAKGMKNFVSWILVMLVTLFTGLVTVQSVFSSGADTMGTKTAKFVLSSTVPVVGSAISDAYGSIKSCFNLIRSISGVMIIILIILLFVPILVKLVACFLVTKLSSVLADFLGTNQISQFLQSCTDAIGLLLAIIMSYILIVVFGTTIILFCGVG